MDDELQNHRGPAAKRTELERCKSYFTRITVMANERLGQLARFFDLRHETGRVMPEARRQSTAKSEVSFDVEMHDADDSRLTDADCESDPDYASSPAFGIRQADDDEAMEEDTEETYAIEALLDHRPPFASRRNARYYKAQQKD
ncbi:hypothetical protein DL765_007914 [Monosporascus sp. GIB2]|nr:hypothetical protein DL765_007914 [Monosporascus sp. GIB2]